MRHGLTVLAGARRRSTALDGWQGALAVGTEQGCAIKHFLDRETVPDPAVSR
jgi:hypothetical protein